MRGCGHKNLDPMRVTALVRCKHKPGGYERLPVFHCRDCGRKLTSRNLKKERA